MYKAIPCYFVEPFTTFSFLVSDSISSAGVRLPACGLLQWHTHTNTHSIQRVPYGHNYTFSTAEGSREAAGGPGEKQLCRQWGSKHWRELRISQSRATSSSSRPNYSLNMNNNKSVLRWVWNLHAGFAWSGWVWVRFTTMLTESVE